MAITVKTQEEILAKLNIYKLNEMQKNAISAIETSTNTVLLSPTGTGKTLAFLLPALTFIEPNNNEVQVLILVPSRELAIQIEQVIREMGTGLKVNAVYGGRSIVKDKTELKHSPSILIGTPGRIADHCINERFSKKSIKTLILDEFDKSLEIGFEKDMQSIIQSLPNVNKRILTSATQSDIPGFVGLRNPTIVDFLTDKASNKLAVKMVVSPTRDKTQTLVNLLNHIGNNQSIVFCNFKERVKDVSDILNENNISHSCFSGGMEQKDRERSLIKFRNGSSHVLVSTDLAARGIDIPEMKYLIHYELPNRLEDFTHRNGRTARADKKGNAYILKWEKESLPEFIEEVPLVRVAKTNTLIPSYWKTLFISGGRKDKISKGDIAGLFFKQGDLAKDELGNIELKQDCAFVAVPASDATALIKKLNNTRLKNKKVRITFA